MNRLHPARIGAAVRQQLTQLGMGTRLFGRLLALMGPALGRPRLIDRRLWAWCKAKRAWWLSPVIECLADDRSVVGMPPVPRATRRPPTIARNPCCIHEDSHL